MYGIKEWRRSDDSFPESTEGMGELMVKKNTHGMCGPIPMKFLKSRTLWMEDDFADPTPQSQVINRPATDDGQDIPF
jgi:hypothetical protein